MRLARFLTPATLSAGTVLAAYGGYGAGLGHADGAALPHWLQVAATIATGLGMTGFGLWRSRQPGDAATVSLAAALAALERLVPTLRLHPDGLATLQDLIDVLFEACHRPEIADDPRRGTSRRAKGGPDHV